LIRWTYLRLQDDPPPDSRLFLVPRAGASLRQILEQIVGDTPGSFFDQLRADLSRGREHLTRHGLCETLLDTLAQHADPAVMRDRPDPLAGLEGEARELREYLLPLLPNLLRHPRFRPQLTGPGQIIDELVNLSLLSGSTTRAGRGLPRRFGEADFRLTAGLTQRDLQNADDTVRFAVELGQDNPDGLALREDAARYVNTCLEGAVQSLLDLRGTDFKDVFRRLCRVLGPDKELIVLVEDIAAFEFIDRQLFEAISNEPTADMCRLKTAIGVTDGYLERIDPTHLERARLRVTLDVPIEGATSYVRRFAAGYLNALRTPPALLREWDPATPLPSACTDCPHRAGCHASFLPVVGEAERAVGLFPFNQRSLGEMQRQTHGTHAGDFNPRSFQDGVFRATLEDQASAFEQGTFPSLTYRRQFGQPTTSAARVEDLRRTYGRQADQAQTIQELWGDVPDGVYETFGVRGARTPPPPEHPPESVTPPEQVTPPSVEPVPRQPPPRYPPALSEALTALDAWNGGAELPQEPRRAVRHVLYSSVLADIDWNGQWLRESAVTGGFDIEAINFEGQSKHAARQFAIQVPRELPGSLPTAVGLQGLLLAQFHKGWDFEYEGQDGAYFLRRAVAVVDHVAGLLLAAVRAAYPPGGAADDPLPAAVEVLAVSALLAGTDETSSDADWLSAALAERRWEATGHGPSSPAYQRLLKELAARGVGAGHKRLLELVRDTLNSAKGMAQAYVLDTAQVLPVLGVFRKGGAWPAAAVPARLHGDWQAVAQLRKALREQLRPLLEDERRALKAWLIDVKEKLGRTAPQNFVTQVEEFLREAERLSVFRAGRPGKSASDLQGALAAFVAAPFVEARDAAQEWLKFAEEDLPTDTAQSPRLDRLLPRLVRLRHDAVVAWNDLARALEPALEKTEEKLDQGGVAAGLADDPVKQLRDEVTARVTELTGLVEQLGGLFS
jgi:hypothetical protein